MSRPRLDLDALVGTAWGDRTIVAVSARPPAGHHSAASPRQLVVECAAGHRVMYHPQDVRGRPKACKACADARSR